MEQGQLTGGTTWHAAGLVSQLKSTHSLTKLATYSTRLFEELEDETGQATGYRAPGSISVASDPERWEEMRRGISMASTVGVDIREIGMDELNEKVPLLRTDDLIGALFIPKDGQTSPVDTTMALVKGARSGGATVVEGVAVERLLKEGRYVYRRRNRGRSDCPRRVSCNGGWNVDTSPRGNDRCQCAAPSL